MKEDLKKIEILVIDNGQHHSFASSLAKDFKKIYYYTKWDLKGFPNVKDYYSGFGYKELTKIDDPYIRSDNKYEYSFDRIGLFVFTDLYYGNFQDYLRSIGKNVWGCGSFEEIEIDRWKFKKLLKKLGLPITETVYKKGIDSLRTYLKTVKDRYVKITKFRDLRETFHHVDYDTSLDIINKMEYDSGHLKDEIEFVIEKSIPCEVEYGYDGWTINGEYPKNAVIGIEIKDCAYLMKTIDYDDLPKSLKDINSKLSPVFKENGVKGTYSNEVRGGNKSWTFCTDITLRQPSPPGEIYQEFISNLGEVLYFGAKGILVEPKYTGKYAGEILLTSQFLHLGNYQTVSYPKLISKNVKLRYSFEKDGKYHCIPRDAPEVGAVVFIGNSLKEVIEGLKYVCSKIEGYNIKSKIDTLDLAIEGVEKLEKIGIKF